MAGDWIKWEHGLVDKPEVIRLAAILGLAREVIVCRLMKFWEWCDLNIPDAAISETGSAFVILSPRDGDNVAFLDALVWTPGFADALAAVDWIRFRDGRIELPNFGRHNGETAKTRARNAKNQKKKRTKSGSEKPPNPRPSLATPVTEMSPSGGDKTVTRGEERREKEEAPCAGAREKGVATPEHKHQPYTGPPGEKIEIDSDAVDPNAWLVREWFHVYRGPVRADMHREVGGMFEELRRHGITDDKILAEIKAPERNRSEWPSQFQRRLMEQHKPAQKAPGKRGRSQDDVTRAFNERVDKMQAEGLI